MSGFWEDFAEEIAPPPPPTPQSSAPGSWWQSPSQQPAPGSQTQAQAVSPQPVVETGDYHPRTAKHLQSASECPRCGGDNYAEVLPDNSRSPNSLAVKAEHRCYDCWYPSNIVPDLDAGGASGKGGKRARQLSNGAGSWSSASFDNAVKIG